MGKKRSKATCKQKHAKAAAFSSSLKKTVRSVHRGGTTKGQRSRIERSVSGGGIVATTNGSSVGAGASSSHHRRGGGGAGKRPRPDATTKRWTGPQNFKDQRPKRGNCDEEDVAFAREVASLNEREGRDRVKREQASLARRRRRQEQPGRDGGKGTGGGRATGGARGESSLFGCPSFATFKGEGGGGGDGGPLRDMVHDAADRVASGLNVEVARSNCCAGALASGAVSPRAGHPWDHSPDDQRSKWILDQERSMEAEERARVHERESGNRYAAFADDLDSGDEGVGIDGDVDGGGRGARGKKVAKPLTFAPPSFQFKSTVTATSRCEEREEEVDPDL